MRCARTAGRSRASRSRPTSARNARRPSTATSVATPPPPSPRGVHTRRDILRAGAALALASFELKPADIVERALAATPAGCGRLQDIEHIVIFVQENRSMDHYFG